MDKEEYMKKLNIVLKLLLTDIPDTYDDTLNSKLLDSISKDTSIHEYLAEYLLKKLNLSDLPNKDIEIQTFYLNLIANVFEKSINQIDGSEFLDKLIEYLKNHADDTNLEYSVINLLIKLSSNTKSIPFALKKFIKDSYLHNFKLFYDKSIFISKLYRNLVEVTLKQEYESNDGFTEIDDYFNKLTETSLDYRQTILFAVFDLFLFLYKEFDGQNGVLEHLDAKLKILLQDYDLNLLIREVKLVNTIEAYCFIWFRFKKINDLPLIIESLIKKPNYMFKFLYHLYNLSSNNYILELYLLPINDFNAINENYMKLVDDLKHKESIINDCLLNSSLFMKNLRLDYLNMNSIGVILKHFNLSLKIKKTLLKFLFKLIQIDNEKKTGSYYLLYSILHDYAGGIQCKTNELDLNEDLLQCFILFINNSDAELDENDELIEKQMFNHMIKYVLNNKSLYLNALVTLTNESFTSKLISHDNFNFLNNSCLELFENENNKSGNDEFDEFKECIIKIFKNNLSFLLKTPFKTIIDENILNEKFYLSSNLTIRNELIDLINQLFKYTLINNKENASKYLSYYSFIFEKISNDYYNQDVYDIEIKCLNTLYNEFLIINNNNKSEFLNLFIHNTLESILNLINNDYYSSINNKINYYKNIKLYSLKFLLDLNSKHIIPGLNINELTQLYKEISLLCKENVDYENNDLYLNNPLNILDDVISSYEFNMNDNKISDCY